MANTKCGESGQAHSKGDDKTNTTKYGSTTKNTESRVKVQWPRGCSKVFPSCRTTTQSPTQSSCERTEETTTKQEKENQNTMTQNNEEKTTTTSDKCPDCNNENNNEQNPATLARLRAQRRWRMGLLKRSKFGGIGEKDVSDLFPDYFPSPFTIEQRDEDDDILTSLKESKQRHRARLLKQNSIDKIDRELGDRETKLIAGSWLQIYS